MAPLLARAAAADRAFERLYRHHAADVYRYAYAVLRNEADAEDVTQTTFMNAYRALERGEEPQAPQNWLIAIAHNVCRQRFRQQQRRVQEVGLEGDVAGPLVDEDDDAPTPADIRRALGHLAVNQRAALVMRELEGRSYAEIAELLGLSVSAVETLIFRARRALREQLEGSLTCGQAEHFLSKQLAGEERSQLRAHLRECETCRLLARRRRAHRLLGSFASLFGGGGVATKVAVLVVASSVAAGGVGYGAHELLQPAPTHMRHAVVRRAPARPLPATPIAGLAVATHRPTFHTAKPVAQRAPQHVVVRTVARPVHEPESVLPPPESAPRGPEAGEEPQAAVPGPAAPPPAVTTAAAPPAPAPAPATTTAEAPAVTVEVPQVVTVTAQLPPVQVPTIPAPPTLPGLGH
jgi:RNA polymerase sigma-70 factor, ECF subfamily